MRIRIADLLVEWQDEHSDFVSGFAAETEEQPIMSVRFADKLPECHGIQYTDRSSAHLLRLENGELLCANENWSEATEYFSSKASEYALPLAAICSKFSYHNAFLLHASCVDCNGEGVLFTGFSGIGKTTQAKLWQEYLGAEIINGDKAFVREIDGNFYGCGLPWKGSSEYCVNKKTKLKGIVVLRQSEVNRITKLNAAAEMELFMPHAFLPHWDEICLGKTLDTFGKLLDKVPVWLLECRPDEDSVRLTYNTVFDLWKN